MTTAELRIEAEMVKSEAGGEMTTRAAMLLAAADEIDRMESDRAMIRDLFAAAALAGNLAYSHVNASCGNYQENCSREFLARECFNAADAMMAERARREKGASHE